MGNKRIAILNDTSRNAHFGCYAVMSTLARSLEAANLTPTALWPVFADWREFKSRLLALNVDGIVVNGEGTIHHSLENSAAASLCGLAQFVRQHLDIPVFLVNATLSDIADAHMEQLRWYSGIFARESRSHRYLQSFGIASQIVPDLSLYCEIPDSTRVRTSPPMVFDSVIKSTSRQLEQFATEHGFPFRTMFDQEYRKSVLTRAFYRRVARWDVLNRMLPSLFVSRRVTECKGFTTFVNELATASGIVTGRFHAMTLAVKTRTPFLAIESNTTKVSDFVKDALGSHRRVVNVNELSERFGRGRTADGIPRFDDEELTHIECFLARGRQALADMISTLSQAI